MTPAAELAGAFVGAGLVVVVLVLLARSGEPSTVTSAATGGGAADFLVTVPVHVQ